MECECVAAGFCERYQKMQNTRALAVCKGEILTPEKCAIFRANWARLAAIAAREPGLIQKAANLASATAKWIKAGRPIASPAQQAERLEICSKCEAFNAARTQCRFCGCNLRLAVKMLTKTCPLAKWPAT
jgi:hypothetical protein